MSTFKLAEIQLNIKSLGVWCSDPKIGIWLQDELRKIIPSCQSSIWSQDLSQGVTGQAFSHLQEKDASVFEWMIQQLLQNGWEPLECDNMAYTRALEPTMAIKSVTLRFRDDGQTR